MVQAVVREPVVAMRESPSEASKVVSQAIFAEKVSLGENSGEWVQIETPDGYRGWVEAHGLALRKVPYTPSVTVSRLSAHIYGAPDTEYGPIKTVPYGVEIQALDALDARWIQVALPDGRVGYIQKGDIVPEKKPVRKEDLVQFSRKFRGLPYTWGGRSSFGYDCSGFVQMLYGKIGIQLQRDARQQILDPRFQTVEQLEEGDLVFFGKSKSDIGHVGMYLGGGEFIHATAREHQPWLRISKLSDTEWSGQKSSHYPYRTNRQLIPS